MSGAWCMSVCLSFQNEMVTNCGNMASLLDACGDEGPALTAHLEADRPNPPISTISVHGLKRLYTPTARQMLLGNMPPKGASIKCLEKAILTMEWS